MDIISVKMVTSTVTEFITTTCGKTYVLVQTLNAAKGESSYSVFDSKGADVTNDANVDEMMGRYFSVKSELESGLYSDDVDDDFDPFK